MQLDELEPKRGDVDRDRYFRKVEEKLRKKAEEVFSKERLILDPSGRKVVFRVPDIPEPRFRYDTGGTPQGGKEAEGVGSGDGDVGDPVFRVPRKKGASSDEKDVSEEGHEIEFVDVLVPLDTVAQWVFESLKLPPVDVRKEGRWEEPEDRLISRGKKGVILDRKRTLLSHLKREMALGEKQPWRNDERVYQRWHESTKPTHDAVLCLVRDVSASVTPDEDEIVRVVSLWVVLWLRRNYKHLEVRFVVHDTQAVEVTEEQFFTPATAGGTFVNSGLTLAEKVLDTHYPEKTWNRYLIFFSDGEVTGADVDACVSTLTRLTRKMELVAFGEVSIKGQQQDNILLANLKKRMSESESFKYCSLRGKEGIRDWLLHVFGGRS